MCEIQFNLHKTGALRCAGRAISRLCGQPGCEGSSLFGPTGAALLPAFIAPLRAAAAVVLRISACRCSPAALLAPVQTSLSQHSAPAGQACARQHTKLDSDKNGQHQHKLTSSKFRWFSSGKEAVQAMSRDIHNLLRGKCLACKECPEFISVSGRVLCDYCGCPPARHHREEQEESVESADSG